MLADVEGRVDQQRRRKQQLTAQPVDPAAMTAAIQKFNSSRTSWKQRKDMCIEAVEMLADGMEKTVKAVMVSELYLQYVCTYACTVCVLYACM